jgi:hypothetical protein
LVARYNFGFITEGSRLATLNEAHAQKAPAANTHNTEIQIDLTKYARQIRLAAFDKLTEKARSHTLVRKRLKLPTSLSLQVVQNDQKLSKSRKLQLALSSPSPPFLILTYSVT